jgi:hypothetical protein
MLTLEALTSKFDGVRHWLKQLYADWVRLCKGAIKALLRLC